MTPDNYIITQVVKAKHEKLGGVVRKVFSRTGTIAEDGLTHPFDEATELTKGFAFVNFLNPQDAKQATATLNGWQLDKSHNIKVCPQRQRAICWYAFHVCVSKSLLLSRSPFCTVLLFSDGARFPVAHCFGIYRICQATPSAKTKIISNDMIDASRKPTPATKTATC